MFDWIKSRFSGRNGKYDVPQIAKNDTIEKSKSRVPQDLQHKVQVTVTKNKEINIISPSAEIVEVTTSFKQRPIENFLTSDDEPTSSETDSFKNFTDYTSKWCSQSNSVDLNSLEQTSQISDCVLVDLIQFKDHNSKTCSYETDSDSGISSQTSSQSCENLASIKNTIYGHTQSDSRTSLYLSDSEYSVDSQCLKFIEIHRNNLCEESVCLSDNEYSFDCDLCLHCEPQSTDHGQMKHFSCEREPRSIDQDRTEHNMSDFCYSFVSDNVVLQSFNRSCIRSVSNRSVCLSDSNYSVDTNLESTKEAFEDVLPTFNPKIGFGLNRWYKY